MVAINDENTIEHELTHALGADHAPPFESGHELQNAESPVVPDGVAQLQLPDGKTLRR